MYWTLRKGDREVRTHSKFRMIYLRIIGWKVMITFEGSE